MKNGPYELVIAPPNYPGKLYRNKYVYEHHLNWWLKTKEIIQEGFIIHHKDGNKRNNHSDNLKLLTKKDHTAQHNLERTTYETRQCSLCNVSFKKPPSYFSYRLKMGQTRFYCCRSHQVSHQQQMKYGLIVPV